MMIMGMPNGLDDEAALKEKSAEPVLTLFLGWGSLACRACNVEQASATASQTIIMDYSELQFILAEARERGFIS
jgi:hypothetical protein